MSQFKFPVFHSNYSQRKLLYFSTVFFTLITLRKKMLIIFHCITKEDEKPKKNAIVSSMNWKIRLTTKCVFFWEFDPMRRFDVSRKFELKIQIHMQIQMHYPYCIWKRAQF